VHEGGWCLVSFCLNKFESLCLCVQDLFAYIVFMKDFTPTSCLHLEAGYLPDSSPIRFATKVSTDMTDMAVRQPIRAGCHCQHISLQWATYPNCLHSAPMSVTRNGSDMLMKGAYGLIASIFNTETGQRAKEN